MGVAFHGRMLKQKRLAFRLAALLLPWISLGCTRHTVMGGGSQESLINANDNGPSDNGNPAATLFANNDAKLVANIGDEIIYNWNIVNSSIFSSFYNANQPDTCAGGYDG